MTKIFYIKGDVLNQKNNSERKVITHSCNNLGKWGKGFVINLNDHWLKPRDVYLQSFQQTPKPKLGDIQIVSVTPNIDVINIIGQKGLIGPKNPKPVSYTAIEEAMFKIAAYADSINASVHMPRIGCGLGGGKWEDIEEIILLCFEHVPVPVYVYTKY
jgi:O-acetyl-ADP-ribose deacetylase (regulator of RNase III)